VEFERNTDTHGSWTPTKPVISVGGVFGRTFAYGLVIAAVAGAASGTAGSPIVGTILGGLVGARSLLRRLARTEI